ncbi:TIGR04206 family protein [Natronomonas sp. EA1]|uniref:TIGR04206 family protein n=1 Tax=Natronomonas sp. EA1 TaxID=3421655 RepID=UPI003EBE765E
MAHGSPRRRLLAILLLGLLPWTVLFIGRDVVSFVFLPGLLDYNPAVTPPLRGVPVWELFAAGGGLPRNPEAWPASALLYLLSLASACAGVLGREDPRLTGGALALAGVAHLLVSGAFLHRLAYTPVPIGPVCALALAWWYYWSDVRALVLAPLPEE